jgi:hypothetical protein
MIEKITYNEKQYPVRVSYYALKHVSKELSNGDEVLEIDELMDGDITVLEPLLYHSLVAGHKIEGREMELPRDEMEFVLDQCMTEFMEVVPNFFQGMEEAANKMKVDKIPAQRKE